MSTTAISVSNLSKSYPSGNPLQDWWGRAGAGGKKALDGISLEIATGEVFGLLGPNGAGKTTLVEILATLLLPTAGEAFICGYDVVSQSAQAKRQIGYCPSSADSFYPRLSAVKNLEFFASLHELTAAPARIAAVIRLAGLTETQDVAFQKLSQGMKQRLALGRALLADPPVLLLDEPTKSLDPLLQAEIWRLLRRTLADEMGKTILLVTHSLAEAESVCDRIAILHQGKIVSLGSTAEIQQVLGGRDLAAAFARVAGGMGQDPNFRIAEGAC